MVMGQGIAMTAIGLLLGLGGALAVTRFLSSLLFEIRPSDPATIVGVMAMLGGVALTACYLPARGAMRVDPMVALRYE
jgi:ABC-type antimicrobial peptide transport system permease subunit